MVAEKIAKVKAAARKRGRKVSFGIRLHVIVRETSEEAWAAADRLIANLDDATIAKAQAIFARMDSVGQSRMSALHGGRRDRLVVGPNLWAGRRPGARRRRHGAGRLARGGRGADGGVSRRRRRQLHPVGLPAPRGSLPLRRAGVPAAAAGARPGPRGARRSTPGRSARRSPTSCVRRRRPHDAWPCRPGSAPADRRRSGRSRPGRCPSSSSSRGRSRRRAG